MKDAARRVVVTGMGVVSPLGHDLHEMYTNLLSGNSGICELDGFDAPYIPCRIGGAVKGFNLRNWITDRPTLRNARMMDLPQKWAMCAAKSALTDARAGRRHVRQQRVGGLIPPGLVFALAWGLPVETRVRTWGHQMLRHFVNVALERATSNDDLVSWISRPIDEISLEAKELFTNEMNPALLLQMCPSTAAAYIAIRYNAQGPNQTITSLCAAGAQAIGESAWMIARGDADLMIAGGADSMLNPMDLTAFARLDAVTKRSEEVHRASKPFDRKTRWMRRRRRCSRSITRRTLKCSGSEGENLRGSVWLRHHRRCTQNQRAT